MMRVRWLWCLQVSLMVFVLLPYGLAFIPGGGGVEQRWLDDVLTHLEARLEVCEDTEMREVMEYVLRHYDRVGIFKVRVVQLPEGVAGLNNPLCPGIVIDSTILLDSVEVGAFIIVHEAMHDYPPWFGHSHIDNDRILRSL